MHILVWPLPHRPVQLGWTCQECETPTDIALGVTEARKPSHHFKVHAPGDGLCRLSVKEYRVVSEQSLLEGHGSEVRSPVPYCRGHRLPAV